MTRRTSTVTIRKMTPAQQAQAMAEAEQNVRRYGWDRHDPRCGSNKKVAK